MSFLTNSKHITSTDQELIRQYKQDRDIRVLGELYQRYMDLLYGVCIKYLKEPEAAKDAVMGIFEELVGKLMKYEVVHFKGWLYTVARNFCLMQLRMKQQIPVVQNQEFMQLPENPHLNGVAEKEEHLNQLAKCIDTLSSDQKQSVRLFYLQEKCYKEIAAINHMDWNKVRSLIQNARRNLKICMEKAIITD